MIMGCQKNLADNKYLWLLAIELFLEDLMFCASKWEYCERHFTPFYIWHVSN